MLYRILAAKYRSRRDGAALKPRDLFKLDGFVCVGTDTALYKKRTGGSLGHPPAGDRGRHRAFLHGHRDLEQKRSCLFP